MLSVHQALETLLSAAQAHGRVESIETLYANQRILAEDLISNLHVPPMDNTQMDGYAVRAAECTSGNTLLPVTQRIPAGSVGNVLQVGTAARIFTGAFIPEGADAVVMQEQTRAEEIDGKQFVRIMYQPKRGEWIRRQGEDICAGSRILEAGTVLRAQECGLAASVGLKEIKVVAPLRVAVFFTGDELTMPGEALRPGAIYNSNRYVLRSLLQNLKCEVTDYGIVPDDLEATRATLREAAQHHDVIITSGGVSVGEEDHVKPAVEAEGAIALWQIAMKPGKPLAFGHVRRIDGQSLPAAFLGLPGNPVSSLVTFLLFVRPFLLRMQGVQNVEPQSYRVRADFNWTKADKRNEFLRARVNQNGGLELFPNQSSGVLTSAVWGDGLIDVAPQTTIAEGDLVRFLPFTNLLY
ncbi:molybdopterin molybdotransferase MoeA [Undibacterium cyanobacteriorum]|uniref:Molybdopterin molybdenumtransferase n=1 Tax=Undibacterium cyanobacteriorum TaxID=3073561 RepID=A0ABY9RE52_9BURK|nr:gephyrin-like molybdotransferase Glp [Undibacterium sp. 20NA77.5]WMW79502.1 molybdopterin molybdotransferase MoeA [Undibacterium sp. 20NA77.5]